MNLRVCVLKKMVLFWEGGEGEDERGPGGGDEKNVARHNTLSVENDARLSVAATLPVVIFSVVWALVFGVTHFPNFLWKTKTVTRIFHDVCQQKPLTFHYDFSVFCCSKLFPALFQKWDSCIFFDMGATVKSNHLISGSLQSFPKNSWNCTASTSNAHDPRTRERVALDPLSNFWCVRSSGTFGGPVVQVRTLRVCRSCQAETGDARWNSHGLSMPNCSLIFCFFRNVIIHFDLFCFMFFFSVFAFPSFFNFFSFVVFFRIFAEARTDGQMLTVGSRLLKTFSRHEIDLNEFVGGTNWSRFSLWWWRADACETRSLGQNCIA